MWQTIPTAIFMLSLALVVSLRVAGGWGSLAQSARAPGRLRASVVDNGRWRGDVSKDEWRGLVDRVGVGRCALEIAAESDQDAAAVALAVRAGKFGDGEDAGVGRNEPVGLAFLGMVKYRRRWFWSLITALDRAESGRVWKGAVHHAGVLVWFAGMAAGALAKTGWWKGEGVEEGGVIVSAGSENLRVGGIWIQTILLLVAVFALPYTRGVVRLGAAVPWRMAVLWAQALLSAAVGVASLYWAREMVAVGTSVVYALVLALAAGAATAWSIVAVWAYGSGVKRVIRWGDEGEDGGVGEQESGLLDLEGRRRAYLACVLTRPRHGYAGKLPVARWGDTGGGGKVMSGLEIVLEREEIDSSDGKAGIGFDSSVLEDVPMEDEWNMLEGAAKRRSLV